MKLDEIVTIQLSKDNSKPEYIQIYEYIKKLIQSGEIKNGERLPSIRKLASYFDVNNITVINAYKKLDEDGYVLKKEGSGTYAQNRVKNQSFEKYPELRQMLDGYVQMDNETINFSTSTPSSDLFPVAEFKRLMNIVLDRDGGNVFGYQESQGYRNLRESICAYIKKDGIKCSIEEIHITTGAQQGIDILSKAFLKHGDAVFVERPTYAGALSAFLSRGAKIIEIPVEYDGIDIEYLERELKKVVPKLLYIMPNFQCPTGMTYSQVKRQELLKLSKEYGFIIVEDDYLKELNYVSKSTIPVKSRDKFGDVIYLKSFSKILMPGLRLGFMVVPLKYSEIMLSAKHSSDISTAGLYQRVLDLYLREGIWQTHINNMCNLYKERYQTIINCIKETFPPYVTFIRPGGGLTLWIKLPEGMDSYSLFEMCVHKKVLISPGNIFFAVKPESNYFRLSFAATKEARILSGIKIISESIKELNPKRFQDKISLPFL